MQTIRAAEARANFAALLRRVSENRERIVIERRGKPRVAVVPVEDVAPDEGDSAQADSPRWVDDFLQLTKFAVDHASDAVFWIGPDAGLIYVNGTGSRILGYTADELSKLKIFDIDPEVNEDNWPRAWERIKTKSPYTFEAQHRRKDGSVFPVEVSIYFLRYGDQEIVCSFSRDITQRKAAEDALRESEARLRGILDHAPMEIYLKDAEGCYVEINRHYEELWGVRIEEVRGKLPGDVHQEEAFAKASRAHDLAVLKSGEVLEQEDEVHLDDGPHVLHMTKFPIRDSAGRIAGLGAIAVDVTERKRAEKSLREAERRFHDFARTSSDWFWEMGPDLRFRWFSEGYERKLGLSPDSLIGKTRWEVSADEGEEATWAKHRSDLEAHRPFRDFQYKIVTEGGDLGYRSVSGVPLFDEQGSFQGYRGTATDITKRKQAEEALRRAHDELELRVAERTAELRTANEQLREEEAKLREMLENSPVGVAIVSHNVGGTRLAGDRLFVNSAMVQMFGAASRESFVNSKIEDSGVDIEQLKAVEEFFKSGRELVNLEVQRRRMDGTLWWVSMSTRPIRFNDQDCTMVWHFDITERKRAEKDLRASQTRLIDAIESIPDGFALYDADDRLVLCNDRYRDVYPKHADILVPGSRFEDMLRTGVERGEFTAATGREGEWIAERLRTHADPPGPIEQKLSDGRWLRVEERRTQEGGIVGLRTDITELKRTEQALKEREAQLRQAQRMAKIGVFIWDDVAGGPLHYSEEIADLLGLSMAEMLQKRASHEKVMGFMLPEDRAPYDKVIKQAEEDLSPYVVDYRTCDDAGNQRHWRETGEPVTDEHGRLVRTFGTLQDITAIRKTEDELRESERRYRELFEESPVPILDEDWGSVKAYLDRLTDQGVKDFSEFFRKNPDQLGKAYAAANRFGVTQAAVELYRAKSKEELQAAMSQETADPDELAGYGEMISSFYSGATKFEYEAEEIACDGTPITTRIKAVMPPKYRDDWSRVLVTMEDITDHKKAEDQLRQAQKMEAVGQLTGGVAHDFNNLLAVILGNAEIISIKAGETDPKIEAVIRAATRGAELTGRLLAFSRKQTLQPQAVEINALVEGMTDLLGRTLGETIKIKTSSAPGLWLPEVDPGQLENALLNLAINARDAMPEGGTLVIEAGNASLDEAYVRNHPDVTPGDYVMLAVSDSGSGMSPEVLEHALEPFFTTKEIGEGSGLGLSMVYGFAKQSGGHVAIYSEKDHGTTVKLYLPRAGADAARVSEETATKAPTARGETVLVVEDNADVRQLAVDLLEDLGYRVLQAPDGWAALSVLEESAPPDLLLSDVVLPRGLSGPDLAEKVKRELPAIKILFMSGYAEYAAHHNGLAGNGAALLNKPFRMQELALKVREVLDR